MLLIHRMTWNCVLVMKLFLEHVYSLQAADDKFTINRCMPLWTMMKNGADMKSLGALQKVEKFLKMCNKLAVEYYFDIKKDEKCAHCENDMEGPPVYLPCKDKICQRCYNDTVIIKEMICPICQAEIPPNLKPNEDIHKNEKSKKYFDYKKRINSFFMEVVSQLCFADDTPPSDEVVEKLLSYITRSTNKGTVVTKKMTIFDDSIDPTPVLRLFLLQLLLRTSGDQVSIYLENYLQQTARFVDQDQLVELSLLILQCLEDVYHQDISKSETSEKKEVRMATDMLKNNLHSIDTEELTFVKLYTLAETRFALSVVAKYVQRIYVDKSIKMTRGYRQMIDAAARLCEECGSEWPCIYFIKLLCRRYGLDSYETVCKSGDANMCRWLQMLDLEREEVLECSDLYVVCGNNYIACREMVTRCKLGEDPASLIQQLEALRSTDWKKRVSLLLAVYREMTMSYVYPEDKRKTQPEMYELLYEALSNHQLFQAQTNLLKAVFQNTIWRHVRCLDICPGMELKDQSIICLLVHAGITFLQIPDDTSLLQPLITLALLPQNMAMSYLPTMPQDDLKEVHEALLAARNLNPGENPVAYRCPNGHAYIIGNCGRAVVMDKCRECGANIGGANHQLDKSNKVDDGSDQTKPGHILGRADQRTDVVVGERKMNPVSCAILRLLTHVSMLLGANENPPVICNMIQPNIAIHTLADFLLNHIKLDIASLQRLTGRSVDDVLLLMHKVLDNLTETYNNGGAVPADVLTLRTKDARNRWEEIFCRHCLSPLLRDMETTLKSCNDQMTQDKRLGKVLLTEQYQRGKSTVISNKILRFDLR
ncbi:E3 ubiquitin-protein ligase rnf213-alpha-like [Argopecten irradians]|uniref:E3 ubiquitin-protein ligase rnf213-alpha-like n=1 Tax=Argopecten irradians TaxID=31199 RepID=UPI00371CE71C